MGKGDQKSRRGKISIGSYGVRRPRKKNKANFSAKTKPAAEKVKKTKVEKVEKTTEVKAEKKTTKRAAPKAKKEE